MKNLNISVQNRVATYRRRDGAIVCDNPGYIITFTFDSEWEGYAAKTARFKWNNGFVDIVFTGNTVEAPVIENAERVEVGVYVDDLCTTTPAVIPCEKSILSGAPRAFIPAEEGAEMLERIATLEDELEIAAGMARYNDLRLKALEEGSGGVKLYKHNVYINSGNIGMYANEARIWLSYASPSASPITSLAELKNSPAATMAGTGVYAAWYLNYAYAVYDYEDAPDGPRDVRAVYIDSNEIRIFYITAYAVPSVYTTAIHKAHQVVITDTVTEV